MKRLILLIFTINITICLVSCFSNKKNDYQKSENYANKSDLFLTNDEINTSLLLINKALKIEPSNVFYIAKRGHIFSIMGKTNAALDDFGRAIELSPNYFDAYMGRVDLLLRCNKEEEAFKDLCYALKNDSQNYLVHFYGGLAFFQKNKLEKALDCFNEAINLNPSYPFSYSNRGLIYESLGKTNLAIKDFEKYLQYENDYILLNKLAWLYITEPKFKNREKALNLAIKATQQNRAPEILDTLACVYAEYGNFELAVELEKEAYNKSGNDNYKKMIEIFEQKKTCLEWGKTKK